jgi:hypothetical protein
VGAAEVFEYASFGDFMGACNKLMLIPKATHERISEKAMKNIGSEQSGKRTEGENIHKTQRRP